ncbi:RdgB/HAM1 family non-canonical purine NTP pyrophosphatase [Candidatus Puniceispirillum marinum]|jgi:XTP/dITP diphosphohydrolase|uniref:dITP/XTP pyrophosphatase n=1 Tax=Puniceispirillum marinum (strain IMCC1322) TaxID=488538 RepID=D5BUB7_PUNMI|nr:RdgB/HAM1 family non-canonical purine NTP pyrophosphatase [Candidatus Puniceispirillum marinum]ADE39864.1 HAM1-like protein [Candidatus Puniceispirillum marinum IMCC1322]
MVPRRFTDSKLVIATHNPGKLPEIAAFLDGFDITLVSAGELGLDEPDETETSFTGNAILKARAAALASGLPALADDSGLAVVALNGDPGIYSARWAGQDKDFGMAMHKVEDALTATGTTNRQAAFMCALSIVWPDGHDETVEGTVKGNLVWPPRGANGFGYDPIFVADGYDMTFGEMEPDIKHAIGHRADAFAKLLQRCFDQQD